MAAADFPDGHFTLEKLVINKATIVQSTSDKKEENLKRFLESKRNRPERHAIRNLLGVIAFRGKKVQEAKDYFNKILEPGEDPDNLNAKANLDYVNRQTLSDEEYYTPHQTKSSAENAASNLGPEISSEAEKKRQGRRYAEQAFAFMHENYFETQTHERYSTAMELYNMAMNLAGDLVDRQEKDDWRLGIGLASMKIFKSRSTTEDAAIKHLKTTVNNNCAVINSESADPDMRSDAFLRIGIALGEASRRNIPVNNLVVPPDLAPFIRDQVMCFKKALEYAKSDSSKASIFTSLATVRIRDHDFPGAMKYVNDSIRLDGSNINNFHAYHTRATIRLTQFKRQEEGSLDLLTEAKNDLEFILEDYEIPWVFFKLAEVYYHLAINTSSGLQSEHINQALEMCDKGENIQDGADNPDCHRIRGKCLRFISNHQQ